MQTALAPTDRRTAVQTHPLYPELVAALKDCTPKQRKFLALLPRHDYIPARVVAAMRAEGIATSSNVAYQWRDKPAFVRAREIVESLAAEIVGVSTASTLARINSVIENAIEGDAILTDAGVEVGRKPDRSNALRGLETLAKVTRLVSDDKPGVNVTLHLVDLTGRSEDNEGSLTIDVTPETSFELDPLLQ